MNNSSIQSKYHGIDKVAIGNGQGLQILNSICSIVRTPSTVFQLNNILHVPDIATNLLSVHRFSKDNNCIFVFYVSGFQIQDRKSGKTLFPGSSKNGLYPFPSVISPSTQATALIGETNSAETWHKRLGHPSASILLQIVYNNYLLKDSAKVPFCEF